MASGHWFKDLRVCRPGFCAAPPPPPPPPEPQSACCIDNACAVVTATECSMRHGDWVEHAGMCSPELCASDPPEVRASDCSPVIGSWSQGDDAITLNADQTAELFVDPYKGEWRCLESGGQPMIEISFAELPKMVFVLISHEGEELLCPDIVGAPMTDCARRMDRAVVNFADTWTVSWGGATKGTTKMVLNSSGSGSYDHEDGVITGTVTGAVLSGKWTQSNDASGTFEITMSLDGHRWSGTWKDTARGNGGDWSGVRVSD